MDTLSAMTGRWSTRAFLDKEVPTETIRHIIDAAQRAPSGSNTQPWHVAVVRGQTKQAVTDALLAARASQTPESPDYQYYPVEWLPPYKDRRFACGMALYSALDIKREDKEKRLKVWNDNYRFFGAPVGLFFYIDRKLSKGSWLDTGMFIQNIMLAARAYDLGTCPQASLSDYPDIIRKQLNISDDYHIICGMSLGYPDTKAPINQYRVERQDIDQFTKWLD